MKIVITGASGFIGLLLVNELIASGHTLLLVGRDEKKLVEAFPSVPICKYEQMSERGKGYDLLVHLAVANNGDALPERDFFSANVDFLLDVAHSAQKMGVKRFVNVSSVHALDLNNLTAYARSKREGAAALTAVEGLASETIYLPLVYGSRWAGKLKFLNMLPRSLAVFAFVPLAALKPTLHIEKLAAYILDSETIMSDELIILCNNQDCNPVYIYSKRIFDLTFALSVIVLLGWFLVLIWIAIRLDSPGPGLFTQSRVGKGGEVVFTCYKFRTMQQGTEQAGTHEISAAAVTKLGAFLRKTKIDELPQVLNIIRNDISLIGPRPCLPVQSELIQARRANGVFSIKPGISGLAQINGIDMSEPIMLARLDARYIALRSLMLDLKIVSATATGSGQGDKTAAPRPGE